MAVDRIQHRLCAGRNPDELRMCPTQDAARTLAEAGYGVALLPAMGCRRDSGLTFVPVRDSGRLSYGIYCFSAAQKPETKRRKSSSGFHGAGESVGKRPAEHRRSDSPEKRPEGDE